jgi:Flp pilus assembly protein TadG
MLHTSSSQRVRRGAVAVYVAFSLTMLLGVVALAIDACHMYDDYRRAQNAADAGALAAATQMTNDWNTVGGQGSLSTAAIASAKTQTAAYGFTDGYGSVTVSVTQPTTGLPLGYLPNNGPGYVQVTITYPQKKFFSGIFGNQSFTGQVTALARGGYFMPAGPAALIVLDKRFTDGSAQFSNGNGKVTLSETAAAQIGSINPTGLTVGPNGQITGGQLQLGSSSWSGGSFSNVPSDVVYNVSVQDPYRNLTPPSTINRPNYGSVSLSGNDATTTVLQPGVYTSITASGNASITFEPGIYIITGANNGDGFKFTGNSLSVDTGTPSTETGTGVMFYFTGGTVDIAGNGAVNLPGPTQGNYYFPQTDGAGVNIGGFGMSFWVDKNNPNASYTQMNGNSSTDPVGLTMVGNGSMNVTGVLYGPTTAAKVSGNGDAMGAQMITDQFILDGNNSSVQFGYQGNVGGATRLLSLCR